MGNLPDGDRLRSLVGEELRSGETDQDSLLSDGEIADLLLRHGSPEDALLEAWEIKAGKLANLVTRADGTSSNNLSDLHKQALSMVEMYRQVRIDQTNAGRTRVHKIVRT